jgi:uncharacterized RDD family membrane protein YckC
MSQTDPGWYHAEGDPVGSVRYWDGTQWVGNPTVPSATPPDQQSYGGAGARLGARIIDGLIVAIPIIIALFAVIDFDDFEQSDLVPWTILSIAWGAAYEIGFIGLRGATPGKALLGLKVLDARTGECPPGLGPAAMRWAPALLGLIPVLGNVAGLAIAVASGVMISSDAQNRSVYDRVASTVVVKTN